MMVLDQARHVGLLEHCYRYLAVQQVLTVPQPVAGMSPQAYRRVWNTLHKLLFVLPLVVQVLVFWHDIYTFAIGEMTSPNLALAGLIVSGFFLAVAVVLTVQCFALASDTDKVWDKAAWEIEQERQ